MKFLILIHVLSAIIGVGPTFFGHVLARTNQSPEELRHSLRLSKRLEFFPKIGGTLALLTGIILVAVGNYGSFLQMWMIGSLVLYFLIQVLVIGMIAPSSKKLSQWVFDEKNRRASALPAEQKKLAGKINNIYWVASTLGVLLFIFMIAMP